MERLFNTRREFKGVIICYLLLCMQSFAINSSDNPFCIPILGYGLLVLSILLPFFLFRSNCINRNYTPKVFVLSMSVLIAWLFEYFHSYGKLSILSIIPFLSLFFFCLVNKIVHIDTFRIFHRLFSYFSLFGVLIYILYLFNLFPPLSVADFYDLDNSPTNTVYANYLLGYLLVPPLGIIRLCGLYNEPGLFGTFCGLLLVADKFRLNKYNMFIFLGGLLSFSVAFIIIVLLFYCAKVVLNKSLIGIIAIALILLGFVFLTTFEFDDPALKAFFNRFVFEDGSFSGDDRTTVLFDSLWDKVVKDNGKLWFGIGQYVPPMGASSFKTIIVKHGIFGLLIIYMPMLLSAIVMSKRNIYSLLLVTAFFISIYQRPLIFSITYLVILLGGIQHLKQLSLEEKRVTDFKNKNKS